MKTLLVFCDGTGMDGSLSTLSSIDQPTNQHNGHHANGNVVAAAEFERDVQPQCASNVLRLARSVKSVDSRGNEQIVYYQSGVGSEANFEGRTDAGSLIFQALGSAVASKIRDAYAFIAQNYEDGDQICLFGFSRGAYTARKLSGLIDVIGVLTRKDLSYFFEIWRQMIDKETPVIPLDTRRPKIKCVGVWDTVGSVFNEIDALNIDDTSLPTIVEVALHALSLQENRQKFLPTLWTVPEGGLQPNQVLKQVWFAGAHSDVGGGYERHELSDITLFWMAGEIHSLNLLALDLPFLRSYAQPKPEPWGTSQPHNAYIETPLILRAAYGHETRLESGRITNSKAVFHESVKYSPGELKSSEFMVTMGALQNKFDSGEGWGPKYEEMNEFEKFCKDEWGKPGVGGAKRHGVENPVIVVGPSVRRIR
ncbi:hypothetical protein R3P38DRAFT_650227 [Favolaschia claudopus]|uniref:T6SS Phospholipase effector Tle1-like catalytic domain-containing protein n=1 Tax=Favolaschia claudopus TaxID=2862362 RepID=A0AAW0E6M4_9AGAR